MGELIEHGDNSADVIRIGESEQSMPIKLYQAVYHQITGRTEQIRKRYSENLLIEFGELEQLHHKIMQLCDVHRVVASNEIISVFHEKERKEQFTSFERFKSYNSNSSSPTLTVVLKYNFSIVPAGVDKPQEYVVSVRLMSRVATIKEFENEAPPFMRGRIMGIVSSNTAEVTVDYVDYVVARGFLEAFDEWIRGCRAIPKAGWLESLQGISHAFPRAGKTIAAFISILCALIAIPKFFIGDPNPEHWARFFVIFGGGFYLTVTLAGTVFRRLEQTIDSYFIVSYLKLNKGDEKLISDSENGRRKIIYKFIFNAIMALVLGVVATKLERLV